MAIFPKVAFHEGSIPSRLSVDVEIWTEQATQSLGAIHISSQQNLQSSQAPLAIPLDERHDSQGTESRKEATPGSEATPVSRPRRTPLRRDSLDRREALLKGKEGSRQRRRWENDRLLNNPWACPPLPSDWEVHPTYPKHTVPYYLAPLWDKNIAARALDEREKQKRIKKRPSTEEQSAAKVPKELRGKLKKAKAAKGLLRDLEEQVRTFVKNWEEKMKKAAKEEPVIDSEDEEIVFVGRNGQMNDMPPSPGPKADKGHEPPKDQLLFESLATDRGASFGRWLVHNIATYYGLRHWSITVGDPARREAYVGIKEAKRASIPRMPVTILPCPLWGMV